MANTDVTILDISVATTGPAQEIKDNFVGKEMIIHSDNDGNDVVTIQGRGNDSANWATIYTFQSAGLQTIKLPKQIRAIKDSGTGTATKVYAQNPFNQTLTAHT